MAHLDKDPKVEVFACLLQLGEESAQCEVGCAKDDSVLILYYCTGR